MNISTDTRADLMTLLNSIREKIDPKESNEDIQREIDRHLATLKDAFGRLIKFGQHDVFVIDLMEQLEALATLALEASNKGTLRVKEHGIKSASLILNALGNSRLFRFTWRINPLERLFEDATWRKHFELTTSMAISGAMEIRMIVVADDPHVCEAANVQKLLELFASHERLVAKIVPSADWNAGMVDHAIPSTCLDFGLHGDNLLYQEEAYKPVPAGRFSKDPHEIKRFTHFFDEFWDTVAQNNPASPLHKVKLSQLVSVDSGQERRQSAEDQAHAANPVHQSVARIEDGFKSAAG